MKLLNIVNEMAYPESFSMDEFKKITSFRGRIKYCNQHLQRINSGSGRIVYKIDDEKVLKLARNRKGIAQNETESDYFLHDNYDDIVANCFDSDRDDNLWVEMELARRVKPSDFLSIVGVPLTGENSIEMWLKEIFKMYNDRRTYIVDREVKKFLDDDSPFAYSLHDLVGSFDLAIGDVLKVNSWGKVKRDGEDAIVLVDIGCTNKTLSEYYG
jgi:hypothetical protein